MRLVLVALAAMLLPCILPAQIIPGAPPRPDTGLTAPADTGFRPPFDTTRRARGDTTRRDSTKAPRELVKWEEPDSVMSALLARSGYVSTRYQGKRAVFDAQHRKLTLSGKAAVQREQTILVADTIVYDDSTKIVRAASPPGDTIVLRDPSQGTGDLVALGGLEYDILQHRGIGRGIATSSPQGGQTWYVYSDTSAVQGDTTGQGRNTSYAVNGSVTSCDLPYPHYHFQTKEVKIVSKRILVARPAVLYIADIPVMWLPFIFQDMRAGRRSGIIPPRFGLSDIVRTSPSYRRQIDNLGYYFAISDYMDATVSFDWRSGNSDEIGNVGWTRWNGEWRYRWLDRFLSGAVRTSYSKLSDGQNNFALSWTHQQQFSQRSSLNANVNYTSNTTAIQQQAFTVAQTFAAIASALNFQQALGPANFSIGGTRTQHSGRSEIDQNFPNFTVTTKPVNVTSWMVWSPSLSVTNSQIFHRDAPPIPFLYTPSTTGRGFDSTRVDANERTTGVSFQTPIRFGGFTWNNSFNLNDHVENFPRTFDIFDFETGAVIGKRVYASNFQTRLDWTTGITLPAIFQGKLNLSPSVSIVNADPSSPFLLRTWLTGGRWVHQRKTLQYGLSMSPTLFGFFPGFGPFSRIRHSIQPRISFAYSPAADVSDDFLKALNRARATTITGLAQKSVTVQLDQVFEAKLKAPSDTNPDAGQKIKLLAINLTPLTYDFERARKTGHTGLTSTTFGYRLSSDLLPGLDFSVGYSLFQGDVNSDSAKFKPFRTNVSASLTIGRKSNPFAVLQRIFGGATPPPSDLADTVSTSTTNDQSEDALDRQANVAGPGYNGMPIGINTKAGWSASLSFTSSRSRPIPGAKIFDPATFCAPLQFDQLRYDQCVLEQTPPDSLQTPASGGDIIQAPARSTLRSSTSFSLTPKWAMQWTTAYDFEQHEFADQNVSLQRDMHDWRALLSFSRAPNGNFAFSFFISLKAEPDLKFDYHRSTARPALPASSTTTETP
ncbi:MAG TPA: putative LPS assembly protein LptD [Gemmatimonadaceae bacterium]|nr:putative LPS assembly protein LptD [Gemmatimonadaceae bacterium]